MLIISLLFRENIDWFKYIYSNYYHFIKIKFMLVINVSNNNLLLEFKKFIHEFNIKNILLSEPFEKRAFGPDLWNGHMINLQLIRNILDIEYVTFFASNCIFFRPLEKIDETCNIFTEKYFNEIIKTTDLYNETYSYYSNNLGLSRPGIYKFYIEQFNPEKNCFAVVKGAWLYKISKDYTKVKEYITQNYIYYSQFECLTTKKSVIDEMVDYYFTNNLDKIFKNNDQWCLEEIFPITYFINNNHLFFYLGLNSNIRIIGQNIQKIKKNKNYFYIFKINNRSINTIEEIINFYNN